MLDIAPTELMMVAVAALLVIGPKDLPRAMRVVGHWVGKARGVARQFRSGFDAMVREAELAEMEKKWAEENARIMSEHPPAASLPAPAKTSEAQALQEPAAPHAELPRDVSEDAPPAMVEQPQMKAESAPAPSAASADVADASDPQARSSSQS